MAESGTSSSPGQIGAARSVSVLLPLPLAGAYDYRVPPDLTLEAGAYVVVPLGRRETVGVVWGEGSGELDPARLKDVAERLEAPRMALLESPNWLATNAPLNRTSGLPGAKASACFKFAQAICSSRSMA